jgi:hypothetical protein
LHDLNAEPLILVDLDDVRQPKNNEILIVLMVEELLFIIYLPSSAGLPHKHPVEVVIGLR